MEWFTGSGPVIEQLVVDGTDKEEKGGSVQNYSSEMDATAHAG